MSSWSDEKNRLARRRLARSLPATFPVPVLVSAYARPLIPPAPRLCIESYWRQHPLRADRLARALAALSGTPPGWRWRLAAGEDRTPASFRVPPAPFRDPAFARGKGHCCICGQPVFRFGWHRDLWQDSRPNPRAAWHACCVAAWKLWNDPSTHVLRALKLRQRRRCAATGERLCRDAEVDHRVPLFRLWRDHRDRPWPELLAYWGAPNLQVVNRAAHARKTVQEAGARRDHRAARGSGEPDTAIA